MLTGNSGALCLVQVTSRPRSGCFGMLSLSSRDAFLGLPLQLWLLC